MKKKHKIKILEKENQLLRSQIIWGFYEEEYPIYFQLQQPELEVVTADEVNALVAKLKESRQQLARIKATTC